MAKMGADPSRMGPPQAASGRAGGQRGGQRGVSGGAVAELSKGAASAPPLKPMLTKRPPNSIPDARSNL